MRFLRQAGRLYEPRLWAEPTGHVTRLSVAITQRCQIFTTILSATSLTTKSSDFLRLCLKFSVFTFLSSHMNQRRLEIEYTNQRVRDEKAKEANTMIRSGMKKYRNFLRQ